MRRLWPPPPLLLLLVLLSAFALCGGGAALPPAPTAKHLSTLPPPLPGVRADPDNAPADTPGGSGSSVVEGARSGGGGVKGNGSMAAAPPGTQVYQPMTQRALSVLVLASAALIVYFVIRTVRLRRRNRKTRKYGVLDTNIENTELTPLEQDDDDDDNTLFDANHPRR
ncbi:membrane protein FAM174A [Protobothrops mucrosquamatus]|uniref:membrane protein FAM174A n=1 Tax=Protobothrops mucrosquamatus TaxID=103944 RepID=UPI000775B1BE|nr:membrane protein FAM174A [Protobothrops mucrosquamatus]